MEFSETYNLGFFLKDMVNHYVIAALWSSTYEGSNDVDEVFDDVPFDEHFDGTDLTPATHLQCYVDCARFMKMAAENFPDLAERPWWIAEQVGHDLWLARNGHGVGFRDRGLGADGQALDDMASSLGPQIWFVNQDGKIDIL